VTDTDQTQFRCSSGSTTRDDGGLHSPLSLFIAAAAKPPSAGAPPSATATSNPIDKLYSMQTSYFTAN